MYRFNLVASDYCSKLAIPPVKIPDFLSRSYCVRFIVPYHLVNSRCAGTGRNKIETGHQQM
jgi:hypothetical protein